MMSWENTNIIGIEHEAAHEEVVDEVRARAGDPVERLRGMVDGMEAPQPRHLVQGAMDRSTRRGPPPGRPGRTAPARAGCPSLPAGSRCPGRA